MTSRCINRTVSARAIFPLSVVCLLVVLVLGCTTTEPSAQATAAQNEQRRVDSPEAVAAAKDAQEKTVAALKAVQLACEAYAVDWGFYPTAETMTELRPIVTPTYMYDHDLPDLDGYGKPLAIRTGPDGYLIGSAGPDGIGNTDDDLCLSENLKFTHGSCGLEYPPGDSDS